VTGVAGWNLFSGTCVEIHGKWCLDRSGLPIPKEEASMAAFRDSDQWYTDDSGQERERLDWAILKFGPVALFHQPAVLDDAIAWLRRHGYSVAVVDCGADPSKQGVLDAITAALGFPPGTSLDGFNDYCWQLEIADEGGLAVVLLHYNQVAAADREFAEACSAWDKLLFGRRLMCLVQSDDPRLDFRPVGGHTPYWNPREWLLKDRGVQ
jgi:hypothetical protein